MLLKQDLWNIRSVCNSSETSLVFKVPHNSPRASALLSASVLNTIQVTLALASSHAFDTSPSKSLNSINITLKEDTSLQSWKKTFPFNVALAVTVLKRRHECRLCIYSCHDSLRLEMFQFQKD